MNKAGEGASNGKKIFQITNATKFPAKRELPINGFTLLGDGDSLKLVIM